MRSDLVALLAEFNGSIDAANLADAAVTAAKVSAQEAWREVGATSQPAFQNSWANLPSGSGGGTVTAFFKDHLGLVHIKGIVTSGPPNQAIFTLPAGYRHADTNPWQGYVQTDGGQALVSIASDGTVKVNVDKTGGGWVLLNGAVSPWRGEQ